MPNKRRPEREGEERVNRVTLNGATKSQKGKNYGTWKRIVKLYKALKIESS